MIEEEKEIWSSLLRSAPEIPSDPRTNNRPTKQEGTTVRRKTGYFREFIQVIFPTCCINTAASRRGGTTLNKCC